MNKKQKQTRQQGAKRERINRLQIARETVKVLDDDDLRQVAGGGQMSQGWIEC